LKTRKTRYPSEDSVIPSSPNQQISLRSHTLLYKGIFISN
jgi:hypothetical protein